MTCRGGREAGQKDHLQQLALGQQSGALGGDQPALDGLGANLVDGDAGAVVGDLDDDVAALLDGAQRKRAFGILARGLAHLRRLDAVIQRVAHRVGQRVLDGLQQALVELGLLALHLQVHAAAQRLRKVAHDARHLGEDVRDRLHAGLHHRLAQIGGHHIQAAREQGHIGVGRGGLQHLVAGQHQFADQVHHAVQQRHVDAQRAFGGGPRSRLRVGGCGRARWLGARRLRWRRERVSARAPAASEQLAQSRATAAQRSAKLLQWPPTGVAGSGSSVRKLRPRQSGWQPAPPGFRRCGRALAGSCLAVAGACNSSRRAISAASSPGPSLPSASMVFRMRAQTVEQLQQRR